MCATVGMLAFPFHTTHLYLSVPAGERFLAGLLCAVSSSVEQGNGRVRGGLCCDSGCGMPLSPPFAYCLQAGKANCRSSACRATHAPASLKSLHLAAHCLKNGRSTDEHRHRHTAYSLFSRHTQNLTLTMPATFEDTRTHSLSLNLQPYSKETYLTLQSLLVLPTHNPRWRVQSQSVRLRASTKQRFSFLPATAVAVVRRRQDAASPLCALPSLCIFSKYPIRYQHMPADFL